MKRKKESVQFRYYNLPEDSYVFAKLGPGWIREYGKGIDYLHFHNVLEIGYCRSGTGEMIFRETVCQYQPGDLTIIPRKYPHTTNSTPGTFSHWEYLFIDEEGFIEKVYAGQARRLHRRQMLDAINHDALFFHRDKYPELAGIVLDMMESLRKKEPFFQEETEGLLAALLTKIARIQLSGTEKLENQQTAHAPAVVMQAMEYIGSHFSEEISVEELAKQCNVSESHLRRLFTAHMKMGVLEYINFVRIHKACQMLKDTGMSISEISYRCGFTTTSTFNRNFRRLTGENPCTWRTRPENFAQELLNYPIHSELGW